MSASTPNSGAASPSRQAGRPSRSKSDYEDVIERTPEYEAFMRQLDEFNKQFGVTMHREPVLGGKRLDMYRIYQWVLEAGGFDQVTAARGWKRVTDPFNLPATCTNSAYVVKQLYQKYLWAYEQVYVHGKPTQALLTQKRPFDQLSTGTGEDAASIPNSPEIRPKRKGAPNPSAMNVNSASPPPPMTIPNSNVPPQRIQFAPDEPLHKRLRLMAEANQGASPRHSSHQLQIQTPGSSSQTPSQSHTHHRSQHPRPPAPPTPIEPAPPRRYRAAPASAPQNPDDDGIDEKYLYGAWQNRLKLALASQLPNEVDWAFTKLVRLSYVKNFYLGVLPGVLEEILEHASPILGEMEIRKQGGHIETQTKSGGEIPTITGKSLLHSSTLAIKLERCLQVLHIIRNLAFYPDNALYFSKDFTLLTYISKGLALPFATMYLDIKHQSFEVLEQLSPFILLQGPNDYFLAVLRQTALQDDKSLIISAARTLTAFCANEINAKILVASDMKPIITRFLQLLLVPDEELVTAVLDWFYEFSNLGEEACVSIVEGAEYNALKLLVKFLAWQGFGKRPTGPPPSHTTPVVPPGTRPRSFSSAAKALTPTSVVNGAPPLVNGVPKYQAPMPDSNAAVPMTGVEYAPPVGTPISSIPGVPGYSQPPIGSAYPAYALPAPVPLPYHLPGDLQHLYPANDQSSAPMDTAPPQPQLDATTAPWPCWWNRTAHSNANEGCRQCFATKAELFAHLQHDHLAHGSDQAHDGCRWKGCSSGKGQRWAPNKILRHITTHFGDTPNGSPSKTTSESHTHAKLVAQERRPSFPGSYVAPLSASGPEDDLRGIPLTAMLVLRNLARSPANGPAFAAIEGSLVAKMCAEKRFCKGLAGVLGELQARKEA
ncbi:uncharacterized protein EV422DRAFT_571470 [Fimicolochytrium jonesii]|uniref:uncharacterized protein n=1 Tax=Fimicolochytrium jonesii TaxID=1396493 RepID=UPI0022FE892B|nr:uncharacterized protein EV422DRAFT_571470 [Fimicolochytrium jonesii]KAI8816714.1 hypothetical protein EV422DRAFT_571470 [Fimicolochytrium jonesii]